MSTYRPNPRWEARKIAQVAKPQKIALDCVHLGDETTGPIRSRTYRECEKGHGPQCACTQPQTCGPGLCLDYPDKTIPSSESSADPLTNAASRSD